MSAPSQGEAAVRTGVAPRAAVRVLFCCDPAYYQHLAVAAASLVAANPRNALELHVITSARDPAAEGRLRRSLPSHPALRLTLHDFDWSGRPSWPTSFHITREAYMRLFAAEVLGADVDKILYLDCDLVVLDDVAELWATDLGGWAAAGVPDPFGLARCAELKLPQGSHYVNSGVLLLNLARWRAHDLAAKLAAYVAQEGERLLFHDQDALNAVLAGQIRPLDYRWNVQARMLRLGRRPRLDDLAAIRDAAAAPAILHYTSARKPWLFVMATPGGGLYWRHLQLTAWRGAAPVGRRLSATAEFLVNHLAYALGVDTTWDRLLRTTRVGRALARVIRRRRAPRLRGAVQLK